MSLLNGMLAASLRARTFNKLDDKTLEAVGNIEDENTWLKLQLASLHVRRRDSLPPPLPAAARPPLPARPFPS